MADDRIDHFVPQCYLKAFTRNGTKNSQLFAINIDDGTNFYTKPRNICAERDFDYIEGLPPGELNQRLSGFESVVDGALRRIRHRKSIDDSDDWITVLNLISLVAVRHPRMRDRMRDFQDRVLRMTLGVALATPERWESQLRQMLAKGVIERRPDVTYEDMKQFHEEGEYDIVFPRGSFVDQEFHTQDVVLRTLVDRNWLLCVSDARSGEFITSDSPCCLIHSDGGEPNINRPLGHGLKRTSLLFPLGRRLMAIGTFEGSGGTTYPSCWQVAHLNSIIASRAHRQIYAASSEFRIVFGDEFEPITGLELANRMATGAN